MSDAARAKANEMAYDLWRVLGDKSLGGPGGQKRRDAVQAIENALDAYAAEVTGAKDAEIAALERSVDDWRAKWAGAVERTGSLDAVTERGCALLLANKILDRPSADPDDDLALLSRQLLRGVERAEQAEALVGAMRELVERVYIAKERMLSSGEGWTAGGRALEQLGHDAAILLASPLATRLAEERRAQ